MKRRSFLLQGLATLAFLLEPIHLWGKARAAVARPIPARAVADFGKDIEGTIHVPGSPRYEKLRRGFAAKVDLHPALIVHVATPDDVAKAVLFARKHALTLAVRCGGHSYAGYNSCEGGLVIDLSGLHELAIAPDGSSIRIGAGALSGEVERATAKRGRAAVLGQCPSVGIGGFLLGGGVGPLMGKSGLGCDNVLAVDIVLADGHSVAASADENPELFWAVRGGGGNFGVVTAFHIKLHPVERVLGGWLTFSSSKPAELLGLVRELPISAPDELTLIATLVPAREAKFTLSVQICHVGEIEAGELLLAPLRRSALLVSDTVKALPYLELESQVLAEIAPQHWQNRAGFFPELSQSVIAILAQAIATGPGYYDELSLIHLHGAVTQVPLHATAFPMRSNGFAYGLASTWDPAAGADRSTAWVAATAARLAPFGHGAYVNIMDREDQASVRRAYAENYPRLAALKSRYDPTNVFAINQNIEPAT